MTRKTIWMQSLGRALVAQFHPKILLLSLIPMLLSLFVWGALLWFGLPWVKSQVHTYLQDFQWFQSIGAGWVQWGWIAVKSLLVPLLALWLLLPLIMISMLLLVAVALMPIIGRFVSTRDFPDLEKKRAAILLAVCGML